MRFSVIQHAPDQFSKFSTDAYAASIGQQLTVNTPRGQMPGTLLAAVVQPGGDAVELTFDVPGLDGIVTTRHA